MRLGQPRRQRLAALFGDRVPTFALRDATTEDVAAARAVLVAAITPVRETTPPSIFDAYLAMALQIEADSTTSELIVLSTDDRIVGTVTFFPRATDEGDRWGWPTDAAGLRSMGVHPAVQGSGAADALVDECVRRARAAGATAIVLHTGTFLPRAAPFYERFGFVRDPAHDLPLGPALGFDEPTVELALAYHLDLA